MSAMGKAWLCGKNKDETLSWALALLTCLLAQQPATSPAVPTSYFQLGEAEFLCVTVRPGAGA